MVNTSTLAGIAAASKAKTPAKPKPPVNVGSSGHGEGGSTTAPKVVAPVTPPPPAGSTGLTQAQKDANAAYGAEQAAKIKAAIAAGTMGSGPNGAFVIGDPGYKAPNTTPTGSPGKAWTWNGTQWVQPPRPDSKSVWDNDKGWTTPGAANGLNADGTPIVAPLGTVDHSTESGTTAINDILNGLIGFSQAQIDNFYKEYKSGLPLSRIVDDIRGTPQYAQRFPGMAALAKTGNRISEADYIAKETADRQLMQTTFGASASLYNSTAQLGDLIGKNVSTTELQGRLQGYTDAVLAAPASETQWFKDNGMSLGDLTSFWLNPDVTIADVQKRANMGQLGGIAAQAGSSINAAQAGALAAQGITPGQATQGFGQIGMEGQFQQQLPGDANAPVTQQDLLDATFSNNAQAQQKINLVRQQRQADFQAGGQMATNNQGVAGFGVANTG